MKDLKYLFAYTVPLAAFISFTSTGVGTYAAVIYAFVVLPILDMVLGKNETNLGDAERNNKAINTLFDWMLYFNLPIVFGLMYYVLFQVTTQSYTTSEWIGLSLSAGILLATNGINVAHELGHRQSFIERTMSKVLYSLFVYAFLYRAQFWTSYESGNPDDGATAKYNQSLYAFWIRSVSKQYIDAWKKQMELLSAKNRSFLFYNDMLWYHLIQPLYLLFVLILFSQTALLFAILRSHFVFVFGMYQLYRTLWSASIQDPSGDGKRTNLPFVNSNYNIGRIVLYELTRHSDHHFKSAKKYQLLETS